MTQNKSVSASKAITGFEADVPQLCQRHLGVEVLIRIAHSFRTELEGQPGLLLDKHAEVSTVLHGRDIQLRLLVTRLSLVNQLVERNGLLENT